MSAKPIVLVPGFWLGAWAWDEVASTLRGDGHDVTAVTLPGLESVESDRSSITLSDHVDAHLRCRAGGGSPRRARGAQRFGLLWLRGERSYPRADCGDGVCRHRPGEGRAGSGLQGRRAAFGLGVDREGREPRRAQRRAEGDVPPASRAGARWHLARKRGADKRGAPRHPEHDHLHGVHVRAVQGVRKGGLLLPRRPPRAART